MRKWMIVVGVLGVATLSAQVMEDRLQEDLVAAEEALAAGNYVEAKKKFAECYEGFAAVNNYSGLARCSEGWGTALIFTSQNDSALLVLDWGVEAAQQLEDPQQLGSILAISAEIHTILGRFEEALAANLRSARAFEGTDYHALRSSRLVKIGVCYQRLMEIDSAEHYFLEAIRVKEEIGDSTFLPHAYEAAANFYGNAKGAYGNSVAFFLKGIEMAEATGQDRVASNSLALLAGYLLRYEQYEIAKEYASRSLSMMDTLGLVFYKTRPLTTLAEIAEREGNLAEAEQLYQQNLEIYRSSRDQSTMPDQYHRLARIKIIQGDLSAAREYLEAGRGLLNEQQQPEVEIQYRNLEGRLSLAAGETTTAIQIWEEIVPVASNRGNLTLMESVLRGLAEAKAEVGDYADAYQLLEQHRLIKDSLEVQARSRYAQQLEAEYQRSKKDEAIMRLTYANDLKDLDLASRKKQVLLLGAGIVVAILAAMLGFFLFNQKRRNALILEEKNEVIAQSLAEKDLLLREIHHRVKNNLQLVSSLLNLQSRYIKDPNAVSAINEGRSRVRSMALIHQNLYQKENLTGVHVKQYFSKLLEELFETYRVIGRVDLKLKIDDVNLDVDTIIPIGLILNELVTNSLKYAFPEGESGSLSVELREDADQLHLEVYDDGVGIQDESSLSEPKTFGFRLIQSLAAKLKASMKVESDSGTRVSLLIQNFRKAG
jgi:two-component sensor histidine kinase